MLPDSTELTAVPFGSVDPYAREVTPDFGLYLDERWRPPWPYEYLDWSDFGVPDDPVLVVAALDSLLDRARAGQRVEIGCYGGHGRTGTALACLAILCGQAPGESVSGVCAGYCERAVETDEQEAFARAFTGLTPARCGARIRALRAAAQAFVASSSTVSSPST